jgi:hypothetical protein
MTASRGAATHAGDLYRKSFGFLRHPVRKTEAEAAHLHEVEREGDSGETPFIAILGLLLFLIPIFLVIVGISFAAYSIAG